LEYTATAIDSDTQDDMGKLFGSVRSRIRDVATNFSQFFQNDRAEQSPVDIARLFTDINSFSNEFNGTDGQAFVQAQPTGLDELTGRTRVPGTEIDLNTFIANLTVDDSVFETGFDTTLETAYSEFLNDSSSLFNTPDDEMLLEEDEAVGNINNREVGNTNEI